MEITIATRWLNCVFSIQLLRAGVARAVVIHVTLTSQSDMAWVRFLDKMPYVACIAFEGNDV